MGIIVPETSKSSSSSASPELASLSVTETVNGWHDFKITGYSLSKGIGIGKYIASETFTVGGYSWAIYFYPDGKNLEDNAQYVSLFIALVSEGTDVRALFELTLMDQSGNERHKVHTHFGRQLESGPFTLKYRGSMWGYKRFFKRTTLEISDYLKDDCLQVQCCVGVVNSHTEGPKIYSMPEPMSDMGQHFGQLLESGKGTDVSFEVSGETFAAHKSVLAARSPVFRAQLFGPMKDQNTELIKVDEMEAPVFKESDPLLSNNKDVNDEKKAAQLKFDAGNSQPAPAVIGQATYGWTVNGSPAPRQGSVVGEPVNRAHWDSSLCACLGRNDDFCSSDLEVCILGSVAPCVLYGSNAERLGSSPGTFTNHCLPYSCLYMLSETLFGSNCLAPWFSYPTRSAIRRKFNLEGSCEALSRSCGCCGGLIEDEVQREQCESACDFATHTFCHPCALCQEGRELRRRLPHPGFNAQPVLVMIPPGEQSMGRNGA